MIEARLFNQDSLSEHSIKSSKIPCVILDGPSVNQKFADDIAAHGYARETMDAIELVKQLLKV